MATITIKLIDEEGRHVRLVTDPPLEAILARHKANDDTPAFEYAILALAHIKRDSDSIQADQDRDARDQGIITTGKPIPLDILHPPKQRGPQIITP